MTSPDFDTYLRVRSHSADGSFQMIDTNDEGTGQGTGSRSEVTSGLAGGTSSEPTLQWRMRSETTDYGRFTLNTVERAEWAGPSSTETRIAGVHRSPYGLEHFGDFSEGLTIGRPMARPTWTNRQAARCPLRSPLDWSEATRASRSRGSLSTL